MVTVAQLGPDAEQGERVGPGTHAATAALVRGSGGARLKAGVGVRVGDGARVRVTAKVRGRARDRVRPRVWGSP